jgi:hypothetical protein
MGVPFLAPPSAYYDTDRSAIQGTTSEKKLVPNGTRTPAPGHGHRESNRHAAESRLCPGRSSLLQPRPHLQHLPRELPEILILQELLEHRVVLPALGHLLLYHIEPVAGLTGQVSQSAVLWDSVAIVVSCITRVQLNSTPIRVHFHLAAGNQG